MNKSLYNFIEKQIELNNECCLLIPQSVTVYGYLIYLGYEEINGRMHGKIRSYDESDISIYEDIDDKYTQHQLDINIKKIVITPLKWAIYKEELKHKGKLI